MTTTKIESRDNPRLKLVRKIREGGVRDYIFVEGVRLAEEAVTSGVAIEYCLVEPDFSSGGRQRLLLDAIEEKGIEIVELAKRIFPTIAETKTSQGIVLICRRPAADRTSFGQAVERSKSKVPLLVVLSEVNNPSNLGAVVRTSEAAGVVGIIVTKNSADVFSPKSLRASMGSSFRMPILEEASIMEMIGWGKQRGYIISAASGDGDEVYLEIDWTKPRILVFGSEAHGVRKEILEEMDSTVRIPMEQSVESLNIAVSAGVVLFEARRQALKRQFR